MPLPTKLKEDIQELVHLAATVTDAHLSAVFLPTELVGSSPVPDRGSLRGANRKVAESAQTGISPSDQKATSIDLVAVQSYAKIVRDCRIPVGSGLIGWVADQGRPIHLSPCDVGTSAIGIYVDTPPLKSLVAVPISTQFEHRDDRHSFGVLLCDSLQADSFNNAQVKILERIASLIHRLLHWVDASSVGSQFETSWDYFKQKVIELGDAIGGSSIEVLRLKLESFNDLEASIGLSGAVQHAEQLLRLAQQALPPHFPVTRLPNGDVIIAVDNMMSAFFQQKLLTLADHLDSRQKPMRITLQSYGAQVRGNGQCNLDSTLQQKPLPSKVSSTSGGSRA